MTVNMGGNKQTFAEEDNQMNRNENKDLSNHPVDK